MATTSTGVKITVDTSELDIKFLKSVDSLNASLTKSQRALGLFYNEQGLLTNALGHTVEGLSTSQIKLGQYVDELGRVRTFQNGYTDGLSKTQLALGMYADELGNVYNALGQMVGQTDKAAKAIEKETAQAAKKAAEELEQLRLATAATSEQLERIGRGVETAAQQLGGLGSNLRSLGESLHNDDIKKAGTIIDSLLQARSAAINVQSLGKSISGITGQLFKARSASQALGIAIKALGGPWGAVIATVSAVPVVLDLIDPLPKIQPISDEFKKIEEHAQKAGEAVNNFNDALKHGAFSSAETKADELQNATKKIQEAQDALDKAEEHRKAIQVAAYAIGIGAGTAIGGPLGTAAGVGAAGYLDYREGKKVKAAENDYKNAMGEADALFKKYVDSARESAKSASERLDEERRAFETVLKHAVEAGADSETQAALQKKINGIEEQIATSKEEERRAALKSIGIMEYIDATAKEQAKTAPAIEAFNKTLAEWREKVKEGVVTQEEFNDALHEKQKELLSQLAASYGVDVSTSLFDLQDSNAVKQLEEKFKSGALSLEEFRKKINALSESSQSIDADQNLKDVKKRFEAGQITALQYNALVAGIQKKYAESLEARLKDESDTKKASLEWKDALEKGRVSQEAYAATMSRLKQTVEDQNQSLRSTLASELGVTFDPKEEKGTFNGYAQNVAKLDDALKNSVVTQEEYNDAVAQLKEKARETLPALDERPQATAILEAFKKTADDFQLETLATATRNQLEATSASVKELTTKGKSLNEESLTALEKFNDVVARATDAYEQGIIEKAEYDAHINTASKALASSLEKQAEHERQRREKERTETRSKLGIDSLLEQMKTPLEKYRETMDAVEKAAKQGVINREERGMLEDKAHNEYWEQMNKLSDKAQKGEDKLEKMELGKSSATGSEALYLAQIKGSQIGYQNKMQSTTSQIAQMQSLALQESQASNAYLAVLAESSVSVYRG